MARHILLAAGYAIGLAFQAQGADWTQVDLRGEPQDILKITGAEPKRGVSVLFLPGDAGWRGAAKEMAQSMAGSGYDVYVWDIKRYLTGFTQGRRSTLTEEQIGPDAAAMRSAVAADPDKTVVLVGWSQGAAMSVLAAASQEGKRAFAGVIAMALPESGVLGWRWWDNLTWITRRPPHEPRFTTGPYLSRIAPLPVAVIQAGRDRFTPRMVSHRLLARLRRPRRIRTLEDAPHDFGPMRAALYQQVSESLGWILARVHSRGECSSGGGNGFQHVANADR